MQILDDQAAAKLLEAIAHQAHRDAAGLDSAPAIVQVEARHWLAAWQGCGPDSVKVRPKVGRGRQPARAKAWPADSVVWVKMGVQGLAIWLEPAIITTDNL